VLQTGCGCVSCCLAAQRSVLAPDSTYVLLLFTSYIFLWIFGTVKRVQNCSFWNGFQNWLSFTGKSCHLCALQNQHLVFLK
jgi:hypothetical protein